MKYLLDTNVLSEPLKLMPDKSVISMLEEHQHEIVTAAPIWHELQYGCLRLPTSRKRDLVEHFLSEVVGKNLLILPYDDRAAEWHAKERARLSSGGRPPPFVDGQIAAITKVNGLALVTRNVKDFKLFSGLKTESWHGKK
ncbi:MAG: type II toxin-antitoxin system VapC family toxin [Deltaproteobacteria bacterium]|nr:type II toxin-antitoxin system VapC family toxin [Deltaproteobacteria bacterium]MBW2354213.1 type II toxin-antitoxin system VapC family toxin [Deltaproteobacteria bacterium]HDZ24553.1 type II toxin-antitoxin system VapC family toxin [Desulfobacteraceae bacterium]